ncbi:MAG TPA: hypothetical protein VFA32_19275 [Dehalococcoidia bacterium]|nr:hypothetical protein [Dehalococcoidia bacterium]
MALEGLGPVRSSKAPRLKLLLRVIVVYTFLLSLLTDTQKPLG